MTWLRLLAIGMTCGFSQAAPWTIPMAGNGFVTASASGSRDAIERGTTRWRDASTVFSLYFHVDRACEISLRGRMQAPAGESTLAVRAAGNLWTFQVKGATAQDVEIGKLSLAQPGYVRIDLQGMAKSGESYPQVSDLLVHSATDGLQLTYVKNNEGNMFYWGRRGPSVHMGYEMPRGKNISYSYSEITVKPGDDPPGSYYMANGFGEGYFGIQVKSATERWILFSVWSPFHTNDPQSIPDADRVTLLAKGEGVRGGEFGGEGSGGQSFKVYPWKSGTTYRFLNSAHPDGKGNTVYAAWFGEVGKDGWELIARFVRPKTDKHLTGFHSFLENFYDRDGFRERRSLHGNQWVCDTEGQWHELTRARFTCDATGGGGHRLDFAGGVEGAGFFMRNGGFFNDHVKANQWFERQSTPEKKPVIDFAKLP